MIHRHGVNKPERDISKRPAFPQRYVRELKFENAEEYALEMKSKLIFCSRRQWMRLPFPGKGFQGAIKRHGQHRGPMTMVPNSTVIRVPTAPALSRARCSREKACLDIWAAKELRFRI